MNVNTPLIYAFVKLSEISRSDDLAECRIFGAASLPGRAILFHCQLNNGAVYYRLPVSSFCHFESLDTFPLNRLQPWDCPSLDMEVIVYGWLANQKVQCLTLDDTFGAYVCTFDWNGVGTTAEVAHEHKCLHLIKLTNGQYALQPNNYLLWHEKSNVVIDGSHKNLTTNKEYPTVEGM
jgi:hypothetical protein